MNQQAEYQVKTRLVGKGEGEGRMNSRIRQAEQLRLRLVKEEKEERERTEGSAVSSNHVGVPISASAPVPAPASSSRGRKGNVFLRKRSVAQRNSAEVLSPPCRSFLSDEENSREGIFQTPRDRPSVRPPRLTLRSALRDHWRPRSSPAELSASPSLTSTAAAAVISRQGRKLIVCC